MTKYFCDLCEREIMKKDDFSWVEVGISQKKFSKEICPQCDRIIREFLFSKEKFKIYD